MKTLYVLVNGSLHMSIGKAASQVAHAIVKLVANEHPMTAVKDFGETDPNRIIVLEAKDGEQMRNIKEYLDKARIPVGFYIDEGNHETDPFSITAMAISPFDTAFGAWEDLSDMLSAFPTLGKRRHWWR